MSASSSKGVLVLFCRSKFAHNFNWFREPLLVHLQGRFADRIRVIDISTTRELMNNLFNPVTLFDIAEVHILAEYKSGQIQIDAAQDMVIPAGEISSIEKTSQPGIAGGDFLADAVIKLWFLSHADGPTISMLNEWSDYFDRRFYFLPLIQLKNQIKPKPVKVTRKLPRRKISHTPRADKSTSKPGQFSMFRVMMILSAIGGINHFISDKSEIKGEYDQVVSYEDASYEIAELTQDLDSDSGHLIEHSWVFQRTRWDFTFFVAREWLNHSEQELDAAAVNNNGRGNYNEYWGSVYRRLINANDRRLDNVANALKKHGQELNLDNHDMATFVLSFVQHIHYKIPGNSLGLLAPPQTVRESYGDCDSKSLLYALIMRKLDYETVMYLNRGQRHAMAGVSAQSSGRYLSSRGVRYYFAETTAIGSRIGQVRGGTGGWHLINL